MRVGIRRRRVAGRPTGAQSETGARQVSRLVGREKEGADHVVVQGEEVADGRSGGGRVEVCCRCMRGYRWVLLRRCILVAMNTLAEIPELSPSATGAQLSRAPR